MPNIVIHAGIAREEKQEKNPSVYILGEEIQTINQVKCNIL